MAIFRGTIEDYEKYIGPSIEKALNLLAKNECAQRNGICEFCKQNAELQPVYKQDEETKSIIREVLKKYYNGSFIDVNLEKCEKEIMELHNPIDKIFYFVCQDCLSKLRKGNTWAEEIISKKHALSILNKKYSLRLNDSNTSFSNINKAVPIWWCDINNGKFRNEINLVFNDHRNKTLYHFVIGNNSIQNPNEIFRQKDDRGDISTIKINIDDRLFTDEYSGFQFRRYLRNETVYRDEQGD